MIIYLRFAFLGLGSELGQEKVYIYTVLVCAVQSVCQFIGTGLIFGGFNWLNLGHARWVVHSSTLACSWPELLMLAKVTRPSGLRFSPCLSSFTITYLLVTCRYLDMYVLCMVPQRESRACQDSGQDR